MTVSAPNDSDRQSIPRPAPAVVLAVLPDLSAYEQQLPPAQLQLATETLTEPAPTMIRQKKFTDRRSIWRRRAILGIFLFAAVTGGALMGTLRTRATSSDNASPLGDSCVTQFATPPVQTAEAPTTSSSRR